MHHLPTDLTSMKRISGGECQQLLVYFGLYRGDWGSITIGIARTTLQFRYLKEFQSLTNQWQLKLLKCFSIAIQQIIIHVIETESRNQLLKGFSLKLYFLVNILYDFFSNKKYYRNLRKQILCYAEIFSFHSRYEDFTISLAKNNIALYFKKWYLGSLTRQYEEGLNRWSKII